MELNERNMLLSKAKTAITEMRKELERVRRENDPAIKAELEARVAKVRLGAAVAVVVVGAGGGHVPCVAL